REISAIRLGWLDQPVHDGGAALYRPVDRPAPGMDGQEVELRLPQYATPRYLISKHRLQFRRPRCVGAPDRRPSVRPERDSPGQFSHLDRLDDALARDV